MPCWPARTWPGAARAARRPPRHRAGCRQPAQPQRRRSAVWLWDVGHEGGRCRLRAPGRDGVGPPARPDGGVLRLRRGGGGPQRPGSDRSIELAGDPVALCAALVDVPSVSGDEAALADLVEEAFRRQTPHLEVVRSGDAVLARTQLGRERRVLLAGHLDTVPVADNLPSRRDGNLLYGCGTSDMKAGDAVFAHVVATMTAPRHDLTVVFYDLRRSGSGAQRARPDRARAPAVVGRAPRVTGRADERRCGGGLPGHAAGADHDARAAGALGAVVAGRERDPRGERRAASGCGTTRPREVAIDGCVYREGLQAVRIAGGVAGNVVPDECGVDGQLPVRARPGRGGRRATRPSGVRRVRGRRHRPFAGRAAGSAAPLRHRSSSLRPGRRRRRSTAGRTSPASPRWASPRVNYGPGDPNLAHTRDEHVDVRRIGEAVSVLGAASCSVSRGRPSSLRWFA